MEYEVKYDKNKTLKYNLPKPKNQSAASGIIKEVLSVIINVLQDTDTTGYEIPLGDNIYETYTADTETFKNRFIENLKKELDNF